MTGEHGGCRCNHDDQHDTHEAHDVAVQAPQVQPNSDSKGCCGGVGAEQPTRTDVVVTAGHSSGDPKPS